ncbi:MAG: arginine--tRNA ligase [Planctomycetaceae bacterium]|nr:arginine--tRNA ligase [Planctomycetaceae bacterium]
MNLLATLRDRFRTALADVADDAAAGELAELVLPSQDAKFGDYQANCAMPLGKRLGQPPREVAAALIERLDVAAFCEPPEIAGPGFINLRLKDEWLAATLAAAVADSDRSGVAPVAEPRTYVLDYSSPNVAKPMHVGHIRSTVIGDALYKVLAFVGHRVISDNHIGDWGTQFGMIIYGYKHFVDEAAIAESPVAELGRLYRYVNRLVDYHATKSQAIPALEDKIAAAQATLDEKRAEPLPDDAKAKKKAEKKLRQAEGALTDLRNELLALQAKTAEVEADAALAKVAAAHADIGKAVLAETAALHAGDGANRELWERFLPACRAEMEATYDRLGVKFDHTLGESFYEDKLAAVVDDLKAKQLATESDGAQCVFLEGFDAPFIVQKQDGAFLYATTDLATIAYRMETWSPDAILYVVDHRQSLHFEQLFATARQWGYDEVELQHISFGTVLGEDGRPYKTRTGSAVGLAGLLDEAVDRAQAIAEKSDVLTSDEERRTVAKRIGIGAIKYADLAHNRTSDYKFSYDKMLAMTGNTAAYMQYSYARVHGIFGRGGVDIEQLRTSSAPISLVEPAERALAVALVQFTETLHRVAADYRPNYLTDYLFDLASKYASFFENCPVLKAPSDELRISRLLLCDLTARTIGRGLSLLGIETVDRM